MDTLRKQQLFWDIDLEKLDPHVNQEFIVTRVLQQGDADDFQWAQTFYGTDIMKEVFAKNAQKLNKKSCNFWSLYFNVDAALCTAKRLIQKQSAFWTR